MHYQWRRARDGDHGHDQPVGGEPANFLDIGGGADPERIAKAFNLVLSDEGVDAILVNIFAGINRCDCVAEGVIQAMTKLDVKVPVVVRLSGTNVAKGSEILTNSDVNLITADTLTGAGKKAVGAAKTHQQP
jgi:malate-CoA ligase subunit beta